MKKKADQEIFIGLYAKRQPKAKNTEKDIRKGYQGEKNMTLEQFFQQTPSAAVAFSGGTDSAFLLWAAKNSGCNVCAYYIKTVFQPAFELEDARRLAEELSVPMKVLEADILSCPEAATNGPERC